MVATCVFMFTVLRYFTWLPFHPSSKTALWFTNICLKTIADMENLGRHGEQVCKNTNLALKATLKFWTQAFPWHVFFLESFQKVVFPCQTYYTASAFPRGYAPSFRCYSEVLPELQEASLVHHAPVVCPGTHWLLPAVFTPAVFGVLHLLALYVSDWETTQQGTTATTGNF